MKHRIILITLIGYIILGCGSHNETKEYFVHPSKFVCDYPFNDTTKWIITCRVWGLLKYHHPNVTAGKFDWDKILLDRIEDIYLSTTPELVNAELKEMLDEAGVYEYKRDDNWNDSLNINVNLCWLDNSFLDDALQANLKKIASLSVKPPSYYNLDFNSGMQIMLQHEKSYKSEVYTSYKYRLLTLFRYWNVIYYFFPHKYLMDESWDKTLAESVFPFIKATDKSSYQVTLLKLAASLNDGHGYINPISNMHPTECQNVIKTINGKTIIGIDGGELKKGDIVDCIGKLHIDHIRDSLSVLIPASTLGNKEYRINCLVAELIFFHETDITISRNGQKLKLHVSPITFEKKLSSSYKWISDKIGYVDLSVLETDTIDLMFESFSEAKGIIFDLRKIGAYKYNVNQLNCHLSDSKNTHLFSMVVPDEIHPGSYYWKKNIQAAIPDSIDCTHFKKKIIFLINECTQSNGETKAWVARANFNATLIGRPTSGALGHVVWIPLPGNYMAAFSGFGAFSPDGTQLQRKGIIPDMVVYPTMESIKAGKDEILEAAIEYLN